MKMYRVHDSMRDKLENIREALQTHLDLHEEFDTMPYDEACKLYRTLDQVENTSLNPTRESAPWQSPWKRR